MVTKSLVEVPFSVHGLIFIESVRGPCDLYTIYFVLNMFAIGLLYQKCQETKNRRQMGWSNHPRNVGVYRVILNELL